jgi:hypothetical protein
MRTLKNTDDLIDGVKSSYLSVNALEIETICSILSLRSR